MAGCTFSGFEGTGYSENVHEYEGPQVLGYVPEIDNDDGVDMCGGHVIG